MKNIYTNDIVNIRVLRNSNRGELIKYTARKAKQLNQRFYRLEKVNRSNYKNESAYYYARQETGKDKPRYTESENVLSKMDDDELYEYALSINQKLMSKTSTISGLREISIRRLEGALLSIEDVIGEEINSEQFSDFIRSDGYKLLNDKSNYDSLQVIEDWLDWLEKGVTTKQFIKNYSRFKRKGKQDKGKVNRYFTKLVRNKKHPKNLRKKK